MEENNPPIIISPRKSLAVHAYVTLTIFIMIGLKALVFFAEYARDKGGWESLRYIAAIPVFCSIGFLAAVPTFIFLAKKERSLPVWLLLAFVIVFATFFPALKISQSIQNVIYHKEYVQKVTSDEVGLRSDISKINLVLSQPRTVIDVEKNYLLLKSYNGRNCFGDKATDFYSVVYLPNVKDVNSFETYVRNSLINKEVTASLNEDEFRKNEKSGIKASSEGVDMIEKIPALMDKINTARASGVATDNYSIHQITLDCNFESDIPVNLYFEGTLINNTL